MPVLAEHKIRFRYEGGLADEHLLPGYDGASSIDGLTRAVHIATHAYMTGEIISRATALKRASIRMKPAKQGSFFVELVILMEAYPAMSGAGVALGAPVFYDFLKTAFKRATGFLDAEPETAHLQKIYERRQPPNLLRPPADLDQLAETLEGSLQSGHRPIGEAGTIESITIGSSRQNLVVLDEDSKDWVNTREEAAGIEIFTGNVTRFNALSRNGRAFINQFERVVPVRPDGDFPVADLAFLTWSLHGSNTGAESEVEFQARKITSANGTVKRILLAGCHRPPLIRNLGWLHTLPQHPPHRLINHRRRDIRQIQRPHFVG